MANKAVVGLAAVGVSAYAINEQLQDWRARKERERIQRQRQDNIDALQMRIEGVQRKKKEKGGMEGYADVMHEMQFTKGVWSRVEDILYDLILKVGEDGKPMRNSNRALLNLPLMSTEYGKVSLLLLHTYT